MDKSVLDNILDDISRGLSDRGYNQDLIDIVLQAVEDRLKSIPDDTL